MHFFLSLFSLFIVQGLTFPKAYSISYPRTSGEASVQWKLPDPTLEMKQAVTQEIQKSEALIGADGKTSKLSEVDKAMYITVLSNYLTFLGVDPVKDQKTFKDVTDRIFEASLQFLLCENTQDWICLEEDQIFRPQSEMRINKVRGLGVPFYAGEKLDVKAYFSRRWRVNSKSKHLVDQLPLQTVAPVLGKYITSAEFSGVDAAVYGIDDLEGSMKPVWDAVKSIVAKGRVFRTIVDANDESFRNKNPLPIFFYKGTDALVQFLNQGRTEYDQSLGRVEFSAGNIMHNKFVVFKDKAGAPAAVWTGTSNLSKACMGEEENANVSLFIRNSAIAQAFSQEFEEMFHFDPSAFSAREKTEFPEWKAPYFPSGRVHSNKYSNTKRYFYFKDGTEVKVHFSPTDDGEHRTILPMLYSAKAGDIIRIAMFGSGGLEYVRAIQWAAARGVRVYILIDATTGKSVGSWVKEKLGPIQGVNPYGVFQTGGGIWVRTDDWSGSNHLKAATLSRFRPDGSFLNEVMIVGSQNWSEAGNDQNDENMLTIRNWKTGIGIATEFVEHFDKELWEFSKDL